MVCWVGKPKYSYAGKGITVTTNVRDLSDAGSGVVQQYIHRPLLIGGFKVTPSPPPRPCARTVSADTAPPPPSVSHACLHAGVEAVPGGAVLHPPRDVCNVHDVQGITYIRTPPRPRVCEFLK